MDRATLCAFAASLAVPIAIVLLEIVSPQPPAAMATIGSRERDRTHRREIPILADWRQEGN